MKYGYLFFWLRWGTGQGRCDELTINAGDDADKYENLPDKLIVKAGYKTAESGFIRIKGEQGPNSFTSCLHVFLIRLGKSSGIWK